MADVIAYAAVGFTILVVIGCIAFALGIFLKSMK